MNRSELKGRRADTEHECTAQANEAFTESESLTRGATQEASYLAAVRRSRVLVPPATDAFRCKEPPQADPGSFRFGPSHPQPWPVGPFLRGLVPPSLDCPRVALSPRLPETSSDPPTWVRGHPYTTHVGTRIPIGKILPCHPDGGWCEIKPGIHGFYVLSRTLISLILGT